MVLGVEEGHSLLDMHRSLLDMKEKDVVMLHWVDMGLGLDVGVAGFESVGVSVGKQRGKGISRLGHFVGFN